MRLTPILTTLTIAALAGCTTARDDGSALPPAPSAGAAIGGGIQAGGSNGMQGGAQAGLAPGGPAGGECQAGPANSVIGQAPSANVVARARAASGAGTVRVIGPNEFVTQEFRSDRLNLDTDSDGRIVAVRCG